MVEDVIYIVTNLFRVYVIFRFMRAFFREAGENKKKELLAYGIFFVANTTLYLWLHLAWVNMTCNLVGMAIISMLYTRNIKMNVFVSTIIPMIGIGCDFVSAIPISNYKEGEMMKNPILFIIVDLVFLICELITEKIICVQIKKDELQNFPLILVPLCSIAIIWFMIYFEINLSMEIVVVSVGLLLINFLILYLYNILIGTLIQQYDNKLLKQQVQMYENQLNVIIQTENQVKSFQHDMKHHMNEIKLMAMQYKDTNIQKYIDCMAQYIQNPEEIVSSGNMEIDSLLNYMLRKAKEVLDKVNVEIKIPREMKGMFDINIILANLLENAIEAASTTTEKLLNVNLSVSKGLLKIRIENSYKSTIFEETKGLQTTKKDKKNHGIGLKNVQQIVDKHNGTMEIKTESLFCITIILYMSEFE